MRPVTLSLAALGDSPWCPINWEQVSFAIGLFSSITSGAVLTYSVQHSPDGPENRRQVSISRTTTTATVTDPDHRLSTGDSVIVSGSGDPNLDSPVDAQGRPIGVDITFVDANTYTYTVANTGATASVVGQTYVTSYRVFNHDGTPPMVGLTARADGNYAFPPRSIRLKVTAYTSGKVDLVIIQGMGR